MLGPVSLLPLYSVVVVVCFYSLILHMITNAVLKSTLSDPAAACQRRETYCRRTRYDPNMGRSTSRTQRDLGRNLRGGVHRK